MTRPLKLMYLAGTQDPKTALHYMRRGENDPAALFVPYVRQFLQLCDDTDAEGIVVSSRPPRRRLHLDRFTFYSIPNPLRSAHGRSYELGQTLYGLLVAVLCLLHRPHIVLVGDGIMHYRTIPLLGISGAKIVLSFHNTLWACFSREPDRWKEIARKNRRVFRTTVTAIMCASDTIADNVSEISASQGKPLIQFLPTFARETFDNLADAPPTGPDFTVLYVGRIIPDKGIFDMLCIAETLRDRGAQNLRVVMCGQGPAKSALIDAIEARELGAVVSYIGQQNAEAMLRQYAAANVVAVPTRTTYREGFNHVVAEAVLTRRRVVTSNICPAAHYFDSGIQLAVPDSPESYAGHIWNEYHRQGVGLEKPASVEQFRQLYDPSSGWHGAALRALRCAARESPRIPVPLFPECHT